MPPAPLGGAFVAWQATVRYRHPADRHRPVVRRHGVQQASTFDADFAAHVAPGFEVLPTP